MANPTTNYGWPMPTATDLVTDLPADFAAFGQPVDTSLKALNPETTLGDIAYRSATANTNTRLGIGTTGQVLTVASGVPSWATPTAGMTNPMTTTGDTIYSSSGSTPARLGIGSTGQVLTVAGGVPSWATSAAGTSWTLLNSGGTALTGASTITVSGISSKDKIMVVIPLASSVNSNVSMVLRFNTDTASNYYFYGTRQQGFASYAVSVTAGFRGNAQSSFALGTTQTDVSTYITGTFFLDGGASSGVKSVRYTGGGVNTGYQDQQAYNYGGYYNSASTISSVSITTTDSSNFDAGDIYVYTSA